MGNERRLERMTSRFSSIGSRESSFVPRQRSSLVDQLGSGRLSALPKKMESRKTQPEVMVAIKTTSSMLKNSGKATSGMSEDTKNKNYTRFPPLPCKVSSTPRKAKFLPLPSKQPVVHRRRLSVPEESINRPSKSILKKRHSVSTEYSTQAPMSAQLNMLDLWSLPWERELYFPPITHDGMLVFLDEDGSLPPMLRRLSNADTYNYSQEFLQALNETQSRSVP